MRVFSKTGRVTFQINNRARAFLDKYVSKNKRVYSHGEQVGELVSSGFGWHRIYTEKVMGVRSLLAYVAKQYTTAMNNELRALLAVATGQGQVIAATPNGPFVNYSLATNVTEQPKTTHQPVQVAPKGKPTKDALAALANKFKK